MSTKHNVATLQASTAGACGVFDVAAAERLGVDRREVWRLASSGVIERVLPGVYRFTVVEQSTRQSVTAALLWAGTGAMLAGRSAGWSYRLEGVETARPELAVPAERRLRSDLVDIVRYTEGQQ